MKIVGLTGNIGAGKSTVSKLFRLLGVPIFDADWEGKKMLESSSVMHTELKNLFGNEIFENNKPNRSKIAEIVFKNPEKLKQLNEIVHPMVRQEFANWASLQNSRYVIREAAILIESGAYKDVNAIIAVTCPLRMRIERVMKRDGSDEKKVLDRIKNQMDEKELLKYAHYTIQNDETKLIIPQVLKIHRQLIQS